VNDKGGVVFDKEAAERIRAATLWQENFPQSRKPTRGVPAAPGSPVLVARVTSGTPDGNGNYPGVITQRQPDGTYQDFGTVNVVPLNGEVLMNGKRYAVVAVDPSYAGGPAFVVLGASGGATAFSGAAYAVTDGGSPVSSGVLNGKFLTFATRLYDSDNYIASPPSTMITPPKDGFYLITLSVAWQSNGTGSRQIVINPTSSFAAGQAGPASDLGDSLQSCSVVLPGVGGVGGYKVFASQDSGSSLSIPNISGASSLLTITFLGA
jgi:hypothetical protein